MSARVILTVAHAKLLMVTLPGQLYSVYLFLLHTLSWFLILSLFESWVVHIQIQAFLLLPESYSLCLFCKCDIAMSHDIL